MFRSKKKTQKKRVWITVNMIKQIWKKNQRYHLETKKYN